MFGIILIFSIACFTTKLSNGLILRGSLEADEDWKFVGKFCFLTKGGKVDFQLSYMMNYAYTNMLLYYDDQWSSVYPNKPLNCEQKEKQIRDDQIFNLTAYNRFKVTDCSYDSADKLGIVCNSSRSIANARPRWWFVVFSRCFPENGTKTGIAIDYRFTFTNGEDVFTKHFSADEQGIFETSIALFLTYVILVALTSILARMLVIKRLFHTTFKLFLIAVILQFISILFIMSEYAQFSYSGINTGGCGLVGRLFDAAAQTIFLLMLILLAKGYTVTRGTLRTPTVIKLIVVFFAYVVAYIIAFCYSEAFFDLGLVNYFYSSPGGLALIIIKLIIGWVWFCYAILFTIKNYPEKRKFYYALSIFYSLWFWSSPIVIIITNYAVAQHVREKVGFIVQWFITVVGHVYFLSLTFPSKVNQNFPYHVPTNQIGIVEQKDDEVENYPHHKENEGGNTRFANGGPNELTLQKMFSVQNTSHKYEVDETVTER